MSPRRKEVVDDVWGPDAARRDRSVTLKLTPAVFRVLERQAAQSKVHLNRFVVGILEEYVRGLDEGG